MKKNPGGALLFLLLLVGVTGSFAGITVYNIRDWRAYPSSTNNYAAVKSAVDAAMASGQPAEIRFEAGAIYRIGLPDGPNMQSQYALYIKNASHLVINGQGATLLITHPEIGGICSENSNNVKIKNIKIDYDPLPFAQGTVTAVNHAQYWFDLQVTNGFLEPDQPCFARSMSKWGLTVRDEADGGRRYGPTAVFAERWQKTGERLWRFYPVREGGGYKDPLIQSGLKPGDTFIHKAGNYAQAVAAIKCDSLLWENITVFASPGLAFFPHITSHHTIHNCHVKVKEGRIFSTNADGIHMRGSRGHVVIDSCSFEGMADDAINVHSSALSVQDQPSPDQVLVKKSSYSLHPGDELVLVRSATATVGQTVTVKTVKDAGRNWLVTLAGAIPPLTVGKGFASSDNFYNLSEAADPFVIRRCTFKDYRGRGILVSAHGGLIENNIFDLREGWGVILTYESTRWAEGPMAYDVTVRNNEFHGHGAPPPAILSMLYARQDNTDQVTTTVERPFHDLRIEGNRFYEYGAPVMELSNARNLHIRGNEVNCSEQATRPRAAYASIVLKNCADVIIDELDVQDKDPRHYAVVDIASDCARGEHIHIKNLEAAVHSSCNPVLDQRSLAQFYGNGKLAAYEFFTRHMGKGIAHIETPKQVFVGESLAEAVISFTATERIEPGGLVKLWCPNGATNPQLTKPGEPGFIWIETDTPVETELAVVNFWAQYNQKPADARRFVNVKLLHGLPTGKKLLFHWKNVRVDEHAGRFEGDRWCFQIAVDHNADGYAELIPNAPEIPKLPGPAIQLLARIASTAVKGEPVRLNVCAFDRFGNPATGYSSTLLFDCDQKGALLPQKGNLSQGSLQSEISFKEAGFFWIKVKSADGLAAESNPVEVFATDPGMRLYWGDLHVHTEMSADARASAHTVSSYHGSYNSGRYHYALDFQANADHHGFLQGNYGPEDWRIMQRISNEANETGKFVTLIAAELSGPKGDQNVYVAGDWIPFLNHDPADLVAREKDWAEVKGIECMCIPHHVSQSMRPWDWSRFEPSLQPVCEIFSNHGRAEFFANEPHYSGHGQATLQGRTWIDQLLAGKKLGAIASSDDHWARPGTCGLTGVWAPALTRPMIYEAIKTRRCYASTDARVILHFSADDAEMGQSISCTEPPLFKVRVAAPGIIQRLEVICNGETVYSSEPQKRQAKLTWREAALKNAFYYVRLTLAAEENVEISMKNRQQFVWSSPIWVKCL